MVEEKYRLFRQFMENELGITKDDIKEWVREVAQENVNRMISNQYEKFNIDDLIIKAMTRVEMFNNNKRELNYALREDIADRLAEKILEQINVQ